MESIYVIVDNNNLKYVGRTTQKLQRRLSKHAAAASSTNRRCSSSKLNLNDCEIKCIDVADSPEEAHELEQFYINAIDCVNIVDKHYEKFDQKKYMKEYNKKYFLSLTREQKDIRNANEKKRYHRERDKILVKKRKRYNDKKNLIKG